MPSKREQREKLLSESTLDTSKHYKIENSLSAPSVELNKDDSTAIKNLVLEVIKDGYVINTKTHRRWVMAQTFKMLNHKNGWNGAAASLNYNYVLRQTLEEIRVLGILEVRDVELFKERSKFFSRELIYKIYEHYVCTVSQLINDVPIQQVGSRSYYYKKIPTCNKKIKISFLQKFMDDSFFIPLMSIRKARTYSDLYEILKSICSITINKTASENIYWLKAFKEAGAFYTLKNMIMYHDVVLETYEPQCVSQLSSIEYLNQRLDDTGDYSFHNILLHILSRTNFNFKQSIQMHKA